MRRATYRLIANSKKHLADEPKIRTLGNPIYRLRLRFIGSRLILRHQSRFFRRQLPVFLHRRPSERHPQPKLQRPSQGMAHRNQHADDRLKYFSDGLLPRFNRPPCRTGQHRISRFRSRRHTAPHRLKRPLSRFRPRPPRVRHPQNLRNRTVHVPLPCPVHALPFPAPRRRQHLRRT